MKHNDCNNCPYGGNKMRQKTRSKWHFLWVVLAFLIFFSIFLLIDYKDRVANAGTKNKDLPFKTYTVCKEGYKFFVVTYRSDGGGGVSISTTQIYDQSRVKTPQPMKCK